MSAQSELQTALDEPGRFEALALIRLQTDQMLFLNIAAGTPAEMRAELEQFLLRAVTNTESLDELHEGDEVIYYDLEERPIVLTLFRGKKDRYLLAAVVASNKTYKQILKRLVKSLKTVL